MKIRNEKDFELLQAPVETGNITKAADTLNITQSLGVELLKKYR